MIPPWKKGSIDFYAYKTISAAIHPPDSGRTHISFAFSHNLCQLALFTEIANENQCEHFHWDLKQQEKVQKQVQPLMTIGKAHAAAVRETATRQTRCPTGRKPLPRGDLCSFHWQSLKLKRQGLWLTGKNSKHIA